MTHTDEAIPMPDVPLLRKVLSHIDTHPEEWLQSAYSVNISEILSHHPGTEFEQLYATNTCGTAFCVAGHAVAMTYGVHIDTLTNQVVPNIADFDDCSDGKDWFNYGKQTLGLTADEAFELFRGYNTRGDIQVIAERIARRAGEEL